MGGMNENWLILYNRFIVDSGPGVSAKTASFDHIVKDNVFILKDGKSPMIFLATSDCIGAEIIGNRLYGGNGRFVAGRGDPAVVKNNKVFMLSDSSLRSASSKQDAPRPIPEVPSIYEWQQKQ